MSGSFTNASAQKPAIISFGWDYQGVNDLHTKLQLNKNIPFDGLCFSLQRYFMLAFDTLRHDEKYFEYTKLKSLKWGKLTQNYLILLGFSAGGGHWMDDKAWMTITANMVNLSKAVMIGKLKGIFFDPEYYYQDQFFNPWTYSKKQYPKSSYTEVCDKVRKRGTQFITALQAHATDFDFLSIWITSLILEDMKLSKLEDTRHALLIPFIEGILLGKKETVRVIDGNEYAYWNIRPSQFLNSADYLRKVTVDLMKTDKAKKLAEKIQVSQPIFYDGLLEKDPSYNRNVEGNAKWKWLEENLKYALATSNSDIVWFYTQRLNWWDDKLNDTLVNILKNSKTEFLNQPQSPGAIQSRKKLPFKSNNVNSGKAYYHLMEMKKPMSTGDLAFTYSMDITKKIIDVKFINKIPVSFSVFSENTLSMNIKPLKKTQRIILKTATKNLSLLATYADSREAAALIYDAD